MADININEVYEELKYLGDLPETSRLIKAYLAMREKKYEYSLLTSSGHIVGVYTTSEEQARRRMINGDRLVRREVGEWEEVKDEI